MLAIQQITKLNKMILADVNVLIVTALQTRSFLIFLGSCRKQVFIAYLFFIKTYCYHRGCFQ